MSYVTSTLRTNKIRGGTGGILLAVTFASSERLAAMNIRLALTVFLTGILIACTAVHAQTAETIYTNARVYTVNAKQLWAQAFAIKDGKFIKVGSVAEVSKYRGAQSKIVDLGGRLVLPGFVDEHIHIDMVAENRMNVTFDPTQSYEKFVATIKQFLSKNPKSKWVYGGNLDWLQPNNGLIVAFGKPSNKAILDEIVDDRPAFFWDIGGHAALVNSKLLEVYGITKDTGPPEGGAYDKDENGELTGVLRETAAIALWEEFNRNRPTIEDIAVKGVKPVIADLNRLGITSLTDAGTREFYVSAYGLLDKRGELNMRIAAYITDPSDWKSAPMKRGAADAIANMDRYKTNRVEIIGVKYIMDGSAGGKTLVLVDPYEGTDYRGPWRNPPDDFLRKIVAYDKQGLTVKTHAVGDGAIRLVLDGIERTRKNGSKLRHSIAHSGFVNPQDLPRYGKLNAVAELSPYFWFPTPAIKVIEEELGPKRLRWAWPVKSLIDSKTPYSFGSDWPVTEPNPWPAIEALVTRRVPGKSGGAAFNSEHGITLEQAIYGFTMGGAQAQYREKSIGSIEEGKLADFIVLDQNIFEVPITAVHKTKVLRTVLEGQKVYQHGESPPSVAPPDAALREPPGREWYEGEERDKPPKSLQRKSQLRFPLRDLRYAWKSGHFGANHRCSLHRGMYRTVRIFD